MQGLVHGRQPQGGIERIEEWQRRLEQLVIVWEDRDHCPRTRASKPACLVHRDAADVDEMNEVADPLECLVTGKAEALRDHLEGDLAIGMRESGAVEVEPDCAPGAFARTLDPEKTGRRIDEPKDQPGGCEAVDPRTLTRRPCLSLEPLDWLLPDGFRNEVAARRARGVAQFPGVTFPAPPPPARRPCPERSR